MVEKTQIFIKRLIYRARHDYLTVNNVVIVVAVLIGLSWTWSSIGSMQQNYDLQQLVDTKRQQLELEELRVATLELEGRYYNSLEYQELAVRERLGKAMPGEKLLIVPSTESDSAPGTKPRTATPQPSNFQEWMNFLFGKRA